jgi:tetratricopeptide (TPR) repeat protein
VQRELPNLRRAFDWLLEGGDLEKAAIVATCIDEFLGIFGLHRKQQRLHRRVAQARETQKQSSSTTSAEYLNELKLGEEELDKGRVQSAFAHFQRLLTHIESQPDGTALGPGSLEHAITLERLGRCLGSEGKYAKAEQIYRRAISISEVLSLQDPEDQEVLRAKCLLLNNLGDVLLSQGQYIVAKNVYDQAFEIAEHIDDLRGLAISRENLGKIALAQEDYHQARRCYQQALAFYHVTGDQAKEADIWQQLGKVSQEEQNWHEAERCYRESVSLKEALEDHGGAAETCDLLGQIAYFTHRFAEAKGWFRHTIVLSQQADPTSGVHAQHLSNLAYFLVQEVKTGAIKEISLQLEEARRHAEQALAILQILRYPELWVTFSLLATIAEMQGRYAEAYDYRRQEKEAYVNFAGNRYQIDQQFGKLFPRFVAAQDDLEVRTQMEELLAQLEASGSHVSEAIERIWAGERDWHILVENLNNREALFVKRVLETIAKDADPTIKAHYRSLEQLLPTLPLSMYEVLAKGDYLAFRQAFDILSVQEQQAVIEFMQALRRLQGDEEEEPS